MVKQLSIYSHRYECSASINLDAHSVLVAKQLQNNSFRSQQTREELIRRSKRLYSNCDRSKNISRNHYKANAPIYGILIATYFRILATKILMMNSRWTNTLYIESSQDTKKNLIEIRGDVLLIGHSINESMVTGHPIIPTQKSGIHFVSNKRKIRNVGCNHDTIKITMVT